MAVSVQVQSESRQARADLKRLGNSVDKISSQAERSSKSLKSLAISGAAIFTGAVTLRGLTNITDSYRRLEARIALTVDGAEAQAAAFQEINKIAIETRSNQESLADLYSRIGRATKLLNVSQKDVLQVTRSIAQAITTSGAASASANAAIVQLGQGLAAGALRGQELNSVMEQTPAVAKAIARGLGLTIGELRNFALEGNLTAKAVVDSLKSQKDYLENEFKKIPLTFGQSLVVLGTGFGRLVNAIDDLFGVSRGLSALLQGIGIYINDLAATLQDGIFSKISKFTSDVSRVIVSIYAFTRTVITRFIDMDAIVSSVTTALATTVLFQFGTLVKIYDIAVSVVKSTIGVFKELYKSVVQVFKNIYDTLVGNSIWVDTIDGIIFHAMRMANFVTDIIDYVVNKVRIGFTAIRSIVIAIVSTLSGDIGRIRGNISKLFQDIVGEVPSFSEILAGIKQFIDFISTSVGSAFNLLSNRIRSSFTILVGKTINSVLGNIGVQIDNIFVSVSSKVKRAFDSLSKLNLKSVFARIGARTRVLLVDSIGSVRSIFASSLESTLANLTVAFLVKLRDSIFIFSSYVRESLSTLFGDLFGENIVDKISSSFSGETSVFAKLADQVGVVADFLSQISGTSIEQFGKDFNKYLLRAATSLLEFIGRVQSYGSIILSLLKNIGFDGIVNIASTRLRIAAKNIIDLLQTKFFSTVNVGIPSLFNKLVAYLRSLLAPLSERLISVAQSISQRLRDSVFGSLFDYVVEQSKSAYTAISNIAKIIIQLLLPIPLKLAAAIKNLKKTTDSIAGGFIEFYRDFDISALSASRLGTALNGLIARLKDFVARSVQFISSLDIFGKIQRYILKFGRLLRVLIEEAIFRISTSEYTPVLAKISLVVISTIIAGLPGLFISLAIVFRKQIEGVIRSAINSRNLGFDDIAKKIGDNTSSLGFAIGRGIIDIVPYIVDGITYALKKILTIIANQIPGGSLIKTFTSGVDEGLNGLLSKFLGIAGGLSILSLFFPRGIAFFLNLFKGALGVTAGLLVGAPITEKGKAAADSAKKEVLKSTRRAAIANASAGAAAAAAISSKSRTTLKTTEAKASKVASLRRTRLLRREAVVAARVAKQTAARAALAVTVAAVARSPGGAFDIVNHRRLVAADLRVSQAERLTNAAKQKLATDRASFKVQAAAARAANKQSIRSFANAAEANRAAAARSARIISTSSKGVKGLFGIAALSFSGFIPAIGKAIQIAVVAPIVLGLKALSAAIGLSITALGGRLLLLSRGLSFIQIGLAGVSAFLLGPVIASLLIITAIGLIGTYLFGTGDNLLAKFDDIAQKGKQLFIDVYNEAVKLFTLRPKFLIGGGIPEAAIRVLKNSVGIRNNEQGTVVQSQITELTRLEDSVAYFRKIIDDNAVALAQEQANIGAFNTIDTPLIPQLTQTGRATSVQQNATRGLAEATANLQAYVDKVKADTSTLGATVLTTDIGRIDAAELIATIPELANTPIAQNTIQDAALSRTQERSRDSVSLLDDLRTNNSTLGDASVYIGGFLEKIGLDTSSFGKSDRTLTGSDRGVIDDLLTRNRELQKQFGVSPTVQSEEAVQALLKRLIELREIDTSEEAQPREVDIILERGLGVIEYDPIPVAYRASRKFDQAIVDLQQALISSNGDLQARGEQAQKELFLQSLQIYKSLDDVGEGTGSLFDKQFEAFGRLFTKLSNADNENLRVALRAQISLLIKETGFALGTDNTNLEKLIAEFGTDIGVKYIPDAIARLDRRRVLDTAGDVPQALRSQTVDETLNTYIALINARAADAVAAGDTNTSSGYVPQAPEIRIELERILFNNEFFEPLLEEFIEDVQGDFSELRDQLDQYFPQQEEITPDQFPQFRMINASFNFAEAGQQIDELEDRLDRTNGLSVSETEGTLFEDNSLLENLKTQVSLAFDTARRFAQSTFTKVKRLIAVGLDIDFSNLLRLSRGDLDTLLETQAIKDTLQDVIDNAAPLGKTREEIQGLTDDLGSYSTAARTANLNIYQTIRSLDENVKNLSLLGIEAVEGSFSQIDSIAQDALIQASNQVEYLQSLLAGGFVTGADAIKVVTDEIDRLKDSSIDFYKRFEVTGEALIDKLRVLGEFGLDTGLAFFRSQIVTAQDALILLIDKYKELNSEIEATDENDNKLLQGEDLDNALINLDELTEKISKFGTALARSGEGSRTLFERYKDIGIEFAYDKYEALTDTAKKNLEQLFAQIKTLEILVDTTEELGTAPDVLERQKILLEELTEGAEDYSDALLASGAAGIVAFAGIKRGFKELLVGKDPADVLISFLGGIGDKLASYATEQAEELLFNEETGVLKKYGKYVGRGVDEGGDADVGVLIERINQSYVDLNGDQVDLYGRIQEVLVPIGEVVAELGASNGTLLAVVANSQKGVDDVILGSIESLPVYVSVVGGLDAMTAGADQAVFATGGSIRGPGTGTSDSILARLSNGEFVINAEETRKNYDLLNAINNGEDINIPGFASGGPVTTRVAEQVTGVLDRRAQSGALPFDSKLITRFENLSEKSKLSYAAEISRIERSQSMGIRLTARQQKDLDFNERLLFNSTIKAINDDASPFLLNKKSQVAAGTSTGGSSTDKLPILAGLLTGRRADNPDGSSFTKSSMGLTLQEVFDNSSPTDVKSIGPRSLELIKGVEGFVPYPYYDEDNVCTIGYGSTYDAAGRRVDGATPDVTKSDAHDLMVATITRYADAVAAIKARLTQNMFDSLLSLAYNIGPGAFGRSSVVKFLDGKKRGLNGQSNYLGAYNNFFQFNKDGGQYIRGLAKRRRIETNIFATPDNIDYAIAPPPEPKNRVRCAPVITLEDLGLDIEKEVSSLDSLELDTTNRSGIFIKTDLSSSVSEVIDKIELEGLATGGSVTGPGTGTSDSILARLSSGEFVVNAKDTKKNYTLLKAINSGMNIEIPGFQEGSDDLELVSTSARTEREAPQQDDNGPLIVLGLENTSKAVTKAGDTVVGAVKGAAKAQIFAIKEGLAPQPTVDDGPLAFFGDALLNQILVPVTNYITGLGSKGFSSVGSFLKPFYDKVSDVLTGVFTGKSTEDVTTGRLADEKVVQDQQDAAQVEAEKGERTFVTNLDEICNCLRDLLSGSIETVDTDTGGVANVRTQVARVHVVNFQDFQLPGGKPSASAGVPITGTKSEEDAENSLEATEDSKKATTSAQGDTTKEVAATGDLITGAIYATALGAAATIGGIEGVIAGAAVTLAGEYAKTFKSTTAATGGLITGSGTGTSDSILAMLSNGEYVINARDASKNYELLKAINSGKTIRVPGFVDGGSVLISPPSGAGGSSVSSSSAVFDSFSKESLSQGKESLTIDENIYDGILAGAEATGDSIEALSEGVLDVAKQFPEFLNKSNKAQSFGIDFGTVAFAAIAAGVTAGVTGAFSGAGASAAGSTASAGGQSIPLSKGATGGLVRGSGTGVSDSILAMVSNGEYVINAAATKNHMALLTAINEGSIPKYATGGVVGVDADSSFDKINTAKDSSSYKNTQVVNQTLQVTGNVDDATRRAVRSMAPELVNIVQGGLRENGSLSARR